ncbi:MAG: cupin domain-containing protein [Sneathiella sp.]|nr:cupin domain-containing protein [Sneathiella sp.]
MSKATAISVIDRLNELTCFTGRTPETKDGDMGDAFAVLSEYRDGEIYVGHYSGYSEWERHPAGDEIVTVLDGETNLILLTAEGEISNPLSKGGLFVVPQNIWHRFESPKGVKVFTVTPQPTEHTVIKPQVG